MAITRDPDYPAEMAQLCGAINAVCDGHSTTTVLNACMQIVIAAIGVETRHHQASRDQTKEYARHVASSIEAGVMENFQRQPQPTDVPVRTS